MSACSRQRRHAGPRHRELRDGAEKEQGFDLDVARFLYHSKQGWSGQGGATVKIHDNDFSFGMVSDADRLKERYAGIQAGYERRHVGTDRSSLRFNFLSYHEQWNRTFLEAAPGDIYRTRTHFSPMATVISWSRSSWNSASISHDIGLSLPVAKTESSNAVVTTLRYHQRWGSAQEQGEQELCASYSLRAAPGFSKAIRSSRGMKPKRAIASAAITGSRGRIPGRNHFRAAPLFERLVLGNAETLRGWNKFDLDPLGASHVAHGSIDYSYHAFLVFYDTGAVWDRPEEREQKQSLGLGCRKADFSWR